MNEAHEGGNREYMLSGAFTGWIPVTKPVLRESAAKAMEQELRHLQTWL